MTFARLLFAVCLSALCACGVQARCSKTEALLSSDGGVVPCVQAETCPRPSATFVCINTDDIGADCVACEANACVRFHKVVCP